MRLHPPTTILVLIATGFIAMGAFKEPRSTFKDERCAVAQAYIQAVLDDGQAFEGDKPVILQPTGAHLGDIDAYLQSEKALLSDKVNPLLPLYREQERTQEVSILQKCPQLVSQFDRISTANEDEKPVETADGSYENIYFSVSLPAVSKRGDIAVLDAGFVYAGLAGGGVQVLMMKDNKGRWRIAYAHNTWIS